VRNLKFARKSASTKYSASAKSMLDEWPRMYVSSSANEFESFERSGAGDKSTWPSSPGFMRFTSLTLNGGCAR